jgi:uncharacterized membrane protein YbhN (UPF0104 family)
MTGGRLRGILVPVLKGLVSLVLLGFLFSRISLARFFEVVGGLDAAGVLWSVACLACSNVLGSLQWFLLLKARGSVVDYPRAFRFYFVGLFFNNFLPANVGGDVFRVYDVAREGDDPYDALATTALDRMIGLYSMCLLALAAGAFLAGRGRTPWLVEGVILFVAFLLPGTVLFFSRPGRRLVRKLLLLVPFAPLRRRGQLALDPLGQFTRLQGLVGGLVVFSLFIQGLRILAHVAVAWSMGIEMHPTLLLQMFFYIPLLGLLMVIPVTIGGLGLREGGSTALFSLVGLGEAQAFALTFVTYGLNVGVSLLGGYFFLKRLFAGRR